jgi:hypothetical protein
LRSDVWVKNSEAKKPASFEIHGGLPFNIAKLLQFGMQALNVILALLACEADSSI